MKASTCTSCTVPLKPLVGHCHLRLRCAIARKVSRSKAASPGTGLNLHNRGSLGLCAASHDGGTLSTASQLKNSSSNPCQRVVSHIIKPTCAACTPCRLRRTCP